MDYLRIPIDLPNSFQKRLDRCPLEESIAQHILILIVSHPDEIIGKEQYGSIIWELEFNQLVRVHQWEEQVEGSLLHSIHLHEPRIKDVVVRVTLSEIDEDIKGKFPQVRRKAQVVILAKLCTNDQNFRFSTHVFISPLSQ